MPSSPSSSDTTSSIAADAVEKPNTQARLSQSRWRQGLFWALASPFFLGMVPVLAKLAYAAGVGVITVVAFRTLIAAALLWLGTFLFARHLIRSSKPAVFSSLLAGAINGVGSIYFYSSLTRIDASLGQLINITYLIFVTLMLRFLGHVVSWLTLFRMGLAIFAIYLLTLGGLGPPDWLGVGMMVVAALAYAIQLVLSQRILVDIPAPTMTLYAMTAMAGVVGLAWLLHPVNLTLVSMPGWQAISLMGVATAFSRLTLFLGVKHLGSIQTALLGMLEVIVTIGLATFLLGERLTLVQWLGAVVLLVSILLVRYERDVPRFYDWWQIIWRWRLRQRPPTK